MPQFENAEIAVQNTEAFETLKTQIVGALTTGADRFLSGAASRGINAREFEKMLAAGLLDGQARASELYEKLPLSDQGLIRELYLTKVEEIEPELRRKHSKVYRYA